MQHEEDFFRENDVLALKEKLKHAEQALKNSEDRFQILALQTPDQILYQDKDLRYVWVKNPPLGLTREDMVGKTDFDILDSDDARKLTELKTAVLQTGISKSFSLPLHALDGELQYFEGACIPHQSPLGETIGIIGYFRNITPIIRSEQALRQSELTHRLLINTIPDLVCLKNLEGVFISCNHAFEQFYGAPESEIIGKTDYDFTGREQADFFRMHDRKAVENDGPLMNEERLTFAANGYNGFFETIKTPMKDLLGNTIGVLCISRDVTALKATERALRVSLDRGPKAQQTERISAGGNLGASESGFVMPLPSTDPNLAESDRNSAISPQGDETILLVNNDPSINSVTREMLFHMGYTVFSKTDSQKALELFRKNPDIFDLVINDMNGAPLSGDKLAREILAVRTDIPVIICTGNGDGIRSGNFQFPGIKALLRKPLLKAELASVVRSVLDGREYQGYEKQ